MDDATIAAMTNQETPLLVRCPRCKAPIGSPCVMRGGSAPRDRTAHLPRQDAGTRVWMQARARLAS